MHHSTQIEDEERRKEEGEDALKMKYIQVISVAW